MVEAIRDVKSAAEFEARRAAAKGALTECEAQFVHDLLRTK